MSVEEKEPKPRKKQEEETKFEYLTCCARVHGMMYGSFVLWINNKMVCVYCGEPYGLKLTKPTICGSNY